MASPEIFSKEISCPENPFSEREIFDHHAGAFVKMLTGFEQDLSIGEGNKELWEGKMEAWFLSLEGSLHPQEVSLFRRAWGLFLSKALLIWAFS